MTQSSVIYLYNWDHSETAQENSLQLRKRTSCEASEARVRPSKGPTLSTKLGLGLIALALGGMAGPLSLRARLESRYYLTQLQQSANLAVTNQTPLPPSVPILFNPLVTPDGKEIVPANRDFSLVIPAIGVNAPIIASVDPLRPGVYLEALKSGVAHASTSFLPDQNGTVYLFSHSTNYEWFVKDLNAVFYLLKNLKEGDNIVLFYKNKRYTYKLRDRKVVKPTEISYLVPQTGSKTLILQTCWPPGSVAQRLLLFADLVEEKGTET